MRLPVFASCHGLVWPAFTGSHCAVTKLRGSLLNTRLGSPNLQPLCIPNTHYFFFYFKSSSRWCSPSIKPRAYIMGRGWHFYLTFIHTFILGSPAAAGSLYPIICLLLAPLGTEGRALIFPLLMCHEGACELAGSAEKWDLGGSEVHV